MRAYRYVGPKRIADRIVPDQRGAPIRSPDDVIRWVADSGQTSDADGYVIATFVLDQAGNLLVADRHSEHVACAVGEPVLSAGEMTFDLTAPPVRVVEVSNQSTGYCPEPESWPAVAAALTAAGLEAPPWFARVCVFRRCVGCGMRNLVKDGVFECAVCGRDLPAEYNCQDEAAPEPVAAPDRGGGE
jgi:hypothetical protein